MIPLIEKKKYCKPIIDSSIVGPDDDLIRYISSYLVYGIFNLIFHLFCVAIRRLS